MAEQVLIDDWRDPLDPNVSAANAPFVPGAYADSGGDWFAVNAPEDPAQPPAPPPPPDATQQQQTQVQPYPTSTFGQGAPALPNLANFKSPDPLAPWTGHFAAPTPDDALNSPGFQFRLGEGLKAIQRSAAAKGTLLTGATLKGLQGFSQDYASDEYGKVYDRKYNEYEGERTNFLTNEANRYNSQRGNLQDQWGINSDYFNMGRANRNDDFNIFNSDRNFNYGTVNDTRQFNRMLSNDTWSHWLDTAKLGQPPPAN